MKALIGWKPFMNSRAAGSAQLRCFLPSRYLSEAGWSCELFDQRNAGRYDLVVFQKSYDEESLELAETLGGRGVKTVFDLCDNHFYNPNGDPLLDERAARLRRMIDRVDAVTVSTPELKKVISSKEAVVIDDAVDWAQTRSVRDLYAQLKKGLRERVGKTLRVVWYGNSGLDNPLFGLVELSRIFPSLETLNARLPLALTVISNSREKADRYLAGVSFPVSYYDWESTTFPYLLGQQDICVIPMNVNPLTVCRTNNRLVLSLLHGVPVVADKIPSYEEFADFVLFSDWENSLCAYASDPELRRRHVSQAKKYILSKYNKERVVSQWSSLFRTMLNN